MPKGIMFVPSQPATPEREDEYNDWYSNTHIPEVCEVAGVVGGAALQDRRPGAGRARARARTSRCTSSTPTTSPTVFEEIAARATDGRIQMSDVLSMDPPPVPVIYELLD